MPPHATGQDETESPQNESRRLRVYALVLVLACLLGQLGLDQIAFKFNVMEPGSFVLAFARFLLDAVAVTGIGFFLTETAVFKNQMEERLRRFGIVEGATRKEVLAQYSPQTIRAIELAAQSALIPIDGLPREMETLLESLQGLRESSRVWRSGYRYSIEYVELAAETGLYQLNKSFTFNYVNLSGQTVRHSQVIKLGRLGSDPRVDGRFQSRILLFEVNGIDVLTKAKKLDSNEQIEREVEFDIPAETSTTSRTTVRLVEETYYPVAFPWVLTVNSPTQGIEIAFRFPGRFDPQLHVFGMGSSQKADPLKPLEDPKGYRLWKFDGWLAPRQGLVLSFGTSPKITHPQQVFAKRGKKRRRR